MLQLRRYLRIYVLSNSFRRAETRIKDPKRLKLKFQNQKKVKNHIDILIKYKDNIFYYPNHLYMPYTNNSLENFIKQIERRLKTTEGFGANLDAIKGYLSLVSICYCFRPYADCRNHNKYKNGKSPLEISDVSIRRLDWVRYALNQQQLI